MNIYSNNDIPKKEELFFKVFNNVYLKNLIFSFIHNEGDYSYYHSNSLSTLTTNDRFEIILDKLKDNNQKLIIRGSNCIESFYNYIYKFNQVDKFIIPLMEKYYQNRLIYLNIYIKAIDSKNIGLLKYYLNYFNLDNNNRNTFNNNNNISDKSYILYTLFEYSLNQDLITISEYIYSLIKNKGNYNNNNYNNNNNHVINKILNFDPFDLNFINKSIINNFSIKKLKFIKEKLGIDLKEYIIKNKNNKTIYQNYFSDKKVAEIISHLMVYTEQKIELIFFSHYVYDPDFIKIKVLNSIKDKEKIKILKEQFKNNDNQSCKEIIENVILLMGNKDDELIQFLGVFLIYYYMDEKKYKNIELIINNSSGSRNSNYKITILGYSISQLSIESLKFILSFDYSMVPGTSSYTNHNFKKDLNEAKQFYNQLFNNDEYVSNLKNQILYIVQHVIKIYDNELFQWLYSTSNNFKSLYEELFFKNVTSIIGCHIYLMDIKKIYEFLHIYQILSKDKDLNVGKNFISLEMVVFLINNQISHPIFQKQVLMKLNFLKLSDLSEIIKIHNEIDQIKFSNYFSNYKDNSEKVYLLTNIFILQLIKSILYKDHNSIYQILQIVNKENSINLPESFVENNSHYEILKYLFSMNYLNQFDPTILIDEINQFPDFKYQLFEILPKEIQSTQNIVKNYNEIILYYNLDTKKQELEKEKEKELQLQLIKYNEYYSKNYDLTNGTYSLSKTDQKNITDIIYLLSERYYSRAFDLLKLIEKNTYSIFISNNILEIYFLPIPLEWFIKLYETYFKEILECESSYAVSVSKERFDIFEYFWINRFSNDQNLKIQFIKGLINKIRSTQHQQWYPLLEYILKDKEINQFIVSNLLIFEDQDILISETELILIDGNVELFQLLYNLITKYQQQQSPSNSSTPQIEFKIDSKLFRKLFIYDNNYVTRHHIIEYLFFNNFITKSDLIQFIQEIEEFKNFEIYNDINSNFYIDISSIVLLKNLLLKK